MNSPIAKSARSTEVDSKLLQLLVCPVTKGTLHYEADKQELWSRKARLAFPIRSGVPIMLPEEARPLEDDEMARLESR